MAFVKNLKSDEMELTADKDGKLIKTYRRTYLCENETELTNDEVATNVGILPGAPHPTFSVATARKISVKRRETREPDCAWDHSVEYSTDATVPESNTSHAPDARRVKRKISPAVQTENVFEDKNGDLITDAAGTPFDGGVSVDVRRGVLTFERDVLHADFDMAASFKISGKVNSTTWAGAAPGTVMVDLSAEEKWEGSYHFWTESWTFSYKEKGWNPRPANAGLYEIHDGKRRRIKEADGKDTQQVQPLYPKASTSPEGGSVIPVANRPADCNYIEVEYHDEMDFATFGLPLT